jgi:hypothetical protein
MELTIPQLFLVGTCVIGFCYGLFQVEGMLVDRLLLLCAGIIFLLASVMINVAGSMLGLVPSRSIPGILLFREAPLRDILIPIAYGLISVGIGSLLGKLASEVFARKGL